MKLSDSATQYNQAYTELSPWYCLQFLNVMVKQIYWENISENHHFKIMIRKVKWKTPFLLTNYLVLKLVADFRDTRWINATIINIEMYTWSPL